MKENAMQIQKVRSSIVNFLRDKYNNAPASTIQSGFELGLSGGIDSAVVLTLAYEALGPDYVYCQMLPYHKNDNLKDAIELAETFKVKYMINNIKKAHDTICAEQAWSKLAKENLMARIRMCYLYSAANTHGRLVLGTCNLSEIMVGYFTKWGDGAADVEPLGRLLKKHVYELARDWNEKHADEPQIPEQILTKAPSADLYPGQVDETDIGSYKILDDYLMYRIFGQFTDEVKSTDVARIENLVNESQHKREPIPLPAIPNSFIIGNSEDKLTAPEIIKILRGAAWDTSASQLQDLVRSLLTD